MRKPIIFISAALLFAAQSTVAASISLDANGGIVPIEAAGQYQSARLTLMGPDGSVRELALDSARRTSQSLRVTGLPNGQYRYRVDFVGVKASRNVAADPSSGRAAVSDKHVPVPSVEGGFAISGGQLVPANLVEASSGAASHASNNANAGPTPNVQVIPDDLVVQGSQCVGIDCVAGEVFGFDTFRLKENNLRIHFDDTSVGTFPSTDWELTANDSTSGGANRFSIMDRTALTVPFTVTGAAPSNALFVAANGDIGFGTSTPILRQHLLDTDTPGVRLEQNGGGFGAQTWDVAGNEANFFVRDITNGSRLPFRIRPGAPTSSIDIAANGNVSIGSATTAAAKLDVTGDAIIRGTLSQLSSRTAKENFQLTDGRMVLAKLEKMPISTWNYRGSDAADRHLGPVAEDFHEAFGLGTSDHFVAPTDMAGVALASVKALQQEISERDQRIADLEKRLHELEILVSRAAR